jgi:hypothetical protein
VIRTEGSNVQLDVLLEVLDEGGVGKVGDDNLETTRSAERKKGKKNERTFPAPSNAAVSPGRPPPAPSSNTAFPFPFPLSSGP